MKKILSLSIIVMFAFVLFACGGGAAKGTQEVKDADCAVKGDEKLKQQCDPMPDWMTEPAPVGTFGGEKYVFFYVSGEGATQATATTDAELLASKAAAESINKKVLAQMAKAWETIGDATDQQTESVTKGLIAQKAKVEVSGQVPAGTCMQQFVVTTGVEECKVTEQKGKWICKMRSGIKYSDYQALRAKYIEGAKKEVQLNETQKKLLNEAEKALDSLDDKDDGGMANEEVYQKGDVPA